MKKILLLLILITTILPAQEAKRIPGDPLGVQEYTLRNGLKVYISVNKKSPKVQTYIVAKVGSKNDPSATTGLAHYLEHLLFKGTSKIGTLDFRKENAFLTRIEQKYELYRNAKSDADRKRIYKQIDVLSQHSAEYSAANEYDKISTFIGATGTNAYTGKEKTVFINTVPSNRIDTWIDLEFERFSHPIFRLFHTELETVYEEKNRSLDNDSRLLFEELLATLFPHHQYGTQTTLGTTEHLKKPSIINVKNYYKKHYIPNNMAIVLSGDLDPERVMKKIEATFGQMEKGTLPVYQPPVEQQIVTPIFKSVVGPDQPKVYIAFRLPGASNQGTDLLTMTDMILANGKAGLIDLNVNQSQKVLNGFSTTITMKDYSILLLGGVPKAGQTLEEVKDILLAQVEKLKQGDFADWLPQAVVNDFKVHQIASFSENKVRGDLIVESFTLDQPWTSQVNALNRLGLIGKNQIVDFAKQFLSDNYVVVYKRQGVKPEVAKIEKPPITPIKIDPKRQSEYYKQVISTVAKDIEPLFIDFKTAVTTQALANGNELIYKKNLENDLFSLKIEVDSGNLHNQYLTLAFDYINYLGTTELSNFEVKEQFYKIGCEFTTAVTARSTVISISGLSEYAEEAIKLVHQILFHYKSDPKVLELLKGRIAKSRADRKTNKDVILKKAMINWVKYGEDNPFKFVLSVEDLQKVVPEQLEKVITETLNTKVRILYYGPQELKQITKYYEPFLPAQPTSSPKEKVFPALELEKKVYVYDFPGMGQAQIFILAKGEPFNKDNIAVRKVYNKYFGLGMSSIVFQQMRESQALAYTAYSYYSTPNVASESHYSTSFIGTQADKMNAAISSFFSLLRTPPLNEGQFKNNVLSLKRELQSSRIQDEEVIPMVQSLKKLGIDFDARKVILKNLETLSLKELDAFTKQNISNNTYSILILGDRSKLDVEILKKEYGVVELTLDDLFTY